MSNFDNFDEFSANMDINNNTSEFEEEEIIVFDYDNDSFNEIYQIINTDYENNNNYELDEEIDTETVYVANEIETTDSVDSNDKLKEESYTIPQETQGRLTACCVLDYEGGSFQKCGSEKKLQKLSQLIGIWELDKEIINSVEKDFSRLGVCMSHFNYDQRIHEHKAKSLVSIQENKLYGGRCIFCMKYFYYFSRGKGCNQHSWLIQGKCIQIACIGQIKCSALHASGKVCKRAFNNIIRPRYICVKCYEQQGGHTTIKCGKGRRIADCNENGLHNNDLTLGLELMSKWLNNVAQSQDEDFKKNILIYFSENVLSLKSDSFTNNQQNTFFPPSPFILRIILKLNQINLDSHSQFQINENSNSLLGKQFAQKMYSSYNELKNNKSKLQNPNSLIEYQSLFPKFLLNFFNSFLNYIYMQKLKIINKKRQQRQQILQILNIDKINKILTLLISWLTHISFPSLNLWIPKLLASLSRKSKMLNKFRDFLSIVQIISHTDGQERRLEKKRMKSVVPAERLHNNPNIWNIAVIDNIDFKEKTFYYGNIFNTTRETSHATLRMTFQNYLPIQIEDSIENTINLTKETILFGMNERCKDMLDSWDTILDNLLQFEINNNKEITYKTNFDIFEIRQKLMNSLENGCFCPPPNIVIMDAGGNPSSDEGIFESAKMYEKDFSLNGNQYLDISGDEVIFRRLIKLIENWPNLRPLLGQWHLSKDMISVLITLFSSYGIFDLALVLGVKFLDKLEAVVDYRASLRVIELIWAAVAIAIRIHLKKNNENKYNINNNQNIILKTWYLFYQWGGIFLAHRFGIRLGNYDIQKDTLSAFGPLFPAAGKSNYALSVVHFRAILEKHPKLEEKLRYVASVKISDNKKGHFFAYDEALETFGVKFVKQNITGNVINQDNLKMQISAAQTEYERIEILLAEFLDDPTSSTSLRAIDQRKEAMWKLISKLVTCFDSSDHDNLFQISKSKELHLVGVDRLQKCYDNGLARMKNLFEEEVLKCKPQNKKGRRALDILKTTIKQMNEDKKTKKKNLQLINLETPETQSHFKSTTSTPIINESSLNTHKHPSDMSQKQSSKRQKRFSTEEEKIILEQLDNFNSVPPEEELNKIIVTLNELPNKSDIWDKNRIKTFWRNRQQTIKKKNKT
ncbi:hypothetical protein Glove_332g15 [Diversispora epigaea]|uniref:Uncharacterized protein n=1 Tax=Diversispora epigaea TaxID=1348612 RepID=A0A397HPA2_9GLOM|nr:hypothetical protein Glove_332g15 [Diversispora epigaea]